MWGGVWACTGAPPSEKRTGGRACAPPPESKRIAFDGRVSQKQTKHSPFQSQGGFARGGGVCGIARIEVAGCGR